MKNYLCLFLVLGSISKWRLKKTCSSVRNNWPPLCTWAFLKHTYLSLQRKPEMSRSICCTQTNNSLIKDHENLQEILPELMGFSGAPSSYAWLQLSLVLLLAAGSRNLQTWQKPQCGGTECFPWSTKHYLLFWWLEQHHYTGQRHLTPQIWTVTAWGTDRPSRWAALRRGVR